MLFASKEKGNVILELAIVLLFIVVVIVFLYELIALYICKSCTPIIFEKGW